MQYIIGGHAYSLQDIENGVLRANRKGVGTYVQISFYEQHLSIIKVSQIV